MVFQSELLTQKVLMTKPWKKPNTATNWTITLKMFIVHIKLLTLVLNKGESNLKGAESNVHGQRDKNVTRSV